MMGSDLDWHGDERMKDIRFTSWDGIRQAVVYYHARLLDALNVSAKVGRGTTAKDYTPSKPGDPPRKRTGWLQRHVLYEFDEPNLQARVGIGRAALYGLFLEIGTRFMRARPWLLATLKKFLAQISTLAGSGKAP